MAQSISDRIMENLSSAKTKDERPEVTEEVKAQWFQHKPVTPELESNQKMYSKLFGEVPAGCHDFPVTVFKKSDWDKEIKGFVPAKFEYTVQPECIYWTVYGIEKSKPVFMFGPPGVGKTTGVKYVCAVTNRPYVRINGMAGLEPFDMIGQLHAVNGSTEYKLAKAGIAAQHGAVLAYDEPFKNSAQVNMCFQTLAEKGGKLFLYGHPDVDKQELTPHKQFRFVLCDNVSGTGNDIDKYMATEGQDASFINRMSIRLYMDYMPESSEVQMLVKYNPTVNEYEASKMVSLANLVRKAWANDQVEHPYSPRNLMEWVDAYQFCGDIGESFRRTYNYNGEADEIKQALNNFWRDVDFGVSLS